MVPGDRQNTSPAKGAKPSGKAEKLSQKEQSERFKDTAREIEADESGDAFNAALKKILPAKAPR